MTTAVSARLSSPLARRLGGCLFLALVTAVVTGPDGSNVHPLDGVKNSLLNTRVFGFLVFGLLLFAVTSLSGRTKPIGLTQVRTRLSQAVGQRGTRPTGYLLLLAIAVLVPLQLSPAAQGSLFLDVGIYALLALGLNVVVGYAGLLDLGYIAFYAIGAYTTAYFTSSVINGKVVYPLPVHSPLLLNPFFVFPIAVLIASVAGIILGGPTLRLRGDYLAIVTLGFGEIVQILARNSDPLTNGSRGAFGVPPLSLHIGGFSYTWGQDALPYYYLLLGIVVVVMIAFSRLERSRIGRALAAIREDEVAAEASGVQTLRYKLLAFAIGASTSGFAGVLYATRQFFNPETFSLQASILVLTIVIFGGMGNIFGAVLGAVVLQGLAYILRDPIPLIGFKVPDADRFVYFGAVIMIMMVFRPQGLVPSRRRKREITMSEQGMGSADSLGSGEVSA
ncbi:MAG: braE [Frankiales bacterium]|nr:braE [Frankiales bacterium]